MWHDHWQNKKIEVRNMFLCTRFILNWFSNPYVGDNTHKGTKVLIFISRYRSRKLTSFLICYKLFKNGCDCSFIFIKFFNSQKNMYIKKAKLFILRRMDKDNFDINFSQIFTTLNQKCHNALHTNRNVCSFKLWSLNSITLFFFRYKVHWQHRN
jgi:hypothetical protein